MARPWVPKACAGFPRVEAAVELRRPDRVPVVLFAVNPYCASLAGVRFSDCMLDPGLYVECIVGLAERFEPDVLLNVGCGVSSQVLACSDVIEIDGVRFLRDRRSGELAVRVPDDGNPQALRDGQLPAQDGRRERPDPGSIQAPCPDDLAGSDAFRAAREILGRIGDRMLVSRGVTNASNAVVSWLGFERTCLLMREDRSYVKALAERATAAACAQVKAQAAIGVRVYYTGGSWGSLFGPADYEEFFADSQIQINRTVHECSGLALLHLTGSQSHLVDANLASEPDIVLVDQDNLAEVAGAYAGRACVAGDVDPTKLLLTGPAERVRREVLRQIETAGPAGFMVCTNDCVVRDTPAEHIQAMVDAARGF